MQGGKSNARILQVISKIFLILVEEKIKGVMVKRHIIDAENFRHILTVFGDKLNEVVIFLK